MAVVSPFVVYSGNTALDVRKVTLWSPSSFTVMQVYVRGTPETPNGTPRAAFTAAKQADCDAASFTK